ncbi:7477_t:CDS:2, partial [Gigaspora margarita]
LISRIPFLVKTERHTRLLQGQKTLLHYLKKKKRKSQIILARLTKKNVEKILQGSSKVWNNKKPKITNGKA